MLTNADIGEAMPTSIVEAWAGIRNLTKKKNDIGEAMPTGVVEAWAGIRNLTLLNTYGVTECAVCVWLCVCVCCVYVCVCKCWRVCGGCLCVCLCLALPCLVTMYVWYYQTDEQSVAVVIHLHRGEECMSAVGVAVAGLGL